MSRELLKMVGVSVSSSLCTAIFVVACTASANKSGGGDGGPGDGHAETEGGEDDGGSSGDGDDGPGDDGDDGDAVSAAELAAIEADIASIKCFIGHMTDDQRWNGHSREWREIDDYFEWNQGPNSDTEKAYDDCF